MGKHLFKIEKRNYSLIEDVFRHSSYFNMENELYAELEPKKAGSKSSLRLVEPAISSIGPIKPKPKYTVCAVVVFSSAHHVSTNGI